MSDPAEELTLTPLDSPQPLSPSDSTVGEPAEAPARLERLSFAFARRYGVMLGDWDEDAVNVIAREPISQYKNPRKMLQRSRSVEASTCSAAAGSSAGDP